MNDTLRKAERARQFLESAEWLEAWEAYRSKLLHIIESCDSTNVEAMQNAKRLLTAGQAARAHLERLMVDGKVAAENIKAAEVQKRWFERKRG